MEHILYAAIRVNVPDSVGPLASVNMVEGIFEREFEEDANILGVAVVQGQDELDGAVRTLVNAPVNAQEISLRGLTVTEKEQNPGAACVVVVDGRTGLRRARVREHRA